jgi:hypothetical protein
VLRVSHLSMLWSRAVADQVVSFLESGRFASGSPESRARARSTSS